MELLPDQYTIASNGVSVALLPKEYALFAFLYAHRGQNFSREHLLEKVWPLDYPTERTVDDHIYRLRKKLVPLGRLEIRTVRGYGYCLTERPPAGIDTHPAARDEELQTAMTQVLGKYHLYGQGRSILTLAGQQDVLGYRLNPHYGVMIHFVRGDWKWLLETEETPVLERLYYLLLMRICMEPAEDAIRYGERALALRLLSPEKHTELDVLNLSYAHTLAGDHTAALQRLEKSYRLIESDPDYSEFLLATRNAELTARLMADEPAAVLYEIAGDIERLLPNRPYLRETGSYKVLRGLVEVRHGSKAGGRAGIEEGMQVLEASGFVPMILQAAITIIQFAKRFGGETALHERYSRLVERNLYHSGVPDLPGRLDQVIQEALSL